MEGTHVRHYPLAESIVTEHDDWQEIQCSIKNPLMVSLVEATDFQRVVPALAWHLLTLVEMYSQACFFI